MQDMPDSKDGRTCLSCSIQMLCAGGHQRTPAAQPMLCMRTSMTPRMPWTTCLASMLPTATSSSCTTARPSRQKRCTSCPRDLKMAFCLHPGGIWTGSESGLFEQGVQRNGLHSWPWPMMPTGHKICNLQDEAIFIGLPCPVKVGRGGGGPQLW